MKRENLIAILLFFTGVLLFTRIDFFVNSSLYNYGLKFNENWYVEYLNLYALCYQLLILSLLAYTRSLKLFISMETFILTSTQDIVLLQPMARNLPKNRMDMDPVLQNNRKLDNNPPNNTQPLREPTILTSHNPAHSGKTTPNKHRKHAAAHSPIKNRHTKPNQQIQNQKTKTKTTQAKTTQKP